MGAVDGLNLYRFGRNNPVRFRDPNGTQSASGYASWRDPIPVVPASEADPNFIRGGPPAGPTEEDVQNAAMHVLRDGELNPDNPVEINIHEKGQPPSSGRNRPLSWEAEGPFEQGPAMGASGSPAAPDEVAGPEPEPKLSPGEAMAEIHGFGEVTGEPGKILIEELAVARGGKILSKLFNGVDDFVKRSEVPTGGASPYPGVARNDTSDLPGLADLPEDVGVPVRAADPVQLPRQLAPKEMAALTNTTANLEFSQTYSSGSYWLTRADFSSPDIVRILPWRSDTRWISHTHPSGYGTDASLLDRQALELLGQETSRVIAPSGTSKRFGK